MSSEDYDNMGDMGTSDRVTTAYFDTNVFIHMMRLSGGVRARHVSALRKAISRGRLRILLSVYNLDEIMYNVVEDVEGVGRDLEFVLEFVDRDQILKSQKDVLEEHIAAHLRGFPTPSPVLRDSGILQMVRSLSEPTGRTALELALALGTVRRNKTRFREQAEELRAELRAHIRAEKEQRWSFSEFWSETIHQFLGIIAEGAGFSSLIADSRIEKLLEIDAVRTCAGVWLSRMYAQLFLGHKPQDGDTNDNYHSVMASLVDVFVTHDRKLRDLLNHEEFQAPDIQDIQGLIKRVLG